MSQENWVTINGVHVLIGGNGKIIKGPSKFIGSTVNDIKGQKMSESTKERLKSKYGRDSSKKEPKSKGETVSKSNSTSKNSDSDSPSSSDTKQEPNKQTIQKEISSMNTDYMTENEILSELSSRGINSVEDAIVSNGFNALPKKVSSDEFNKFVQDGGIELSRGISAGSKKEFDNYKDNLVNGDFYVAGGEAYFGKGMYCFGGDSLSQASKYAGGKGGVISMALPKDAKVLEVNGKNGLMSKEVLDTFYKYEDSYSYGKPVKVLKYNQDNRLKDYIPFVDDFHFGVDSALQKSGYKVPKQPDISLLYEDIGKYEKAEMAYKSKISKMCADYIREHSGLSKKDQKLLFDYSKSSKGNNIITASQGYDAIKLSSSYVDYSSSNGNSEIWIILNRGKLVVKED